ncbi:carbamoylphosphate synthase-like protein [Campylobacter sputorum subsp. sputorum]|nr:ATP-grasp domain-containing protein [Campylobacter sputorum]QEL05942.1 carbamoylphosphate synthase-like protein [Campylobacter sputorum subsp. sputorum]
MMYKILIEASGSLSSNFMIKNIHESGNLACGSDIDDFNAAKKMCDDFIIFPKFGDKNLWQKVEKSLLEHKIDIVIPSFDEMLLGWAKRVKYFQEKGIYVIISPFETIELFLDKYKTYQFFKKIGIKTPKTKLYNRYEIIKPRFGRGAKDLLIFDDTISDFITQEKVDGAEYTVDCLFDNSGEAVYIIPRKRIDVKDGKSTKGISEFRADINKEIIKISRNIKFYGAVNFQLFVSNKDIIFIEVNPRIAGGMALGMKASENWILLMIDNFIHNKKIKAKNVKYGLKMARYYEEVFYD